jgi:hypothetical protein
MSHYYMYSDHFNGTTPLSNLPFLGNQTKDRKEKQYINSKQLPQARDRKTTSHLSVNCKQK